MSLTATPAYRTLGLSVPIAEVLDPVRWRQRYAFGVLLGIGDPPAAVSALDQALGCGSTRGKAKTAAGKAEAEAAAALDTEISDDVIRWHLRAALSELEIKLGIPMGAVIVKGSPVDAGLTRGLHYDKEEPRRPFIAVDRANHYRIDLPAGAISVERVRAYWFGQLVWTVVAADGMIQLEHPGTSSMHIVPVQGATLLIASPQIGVPAYGALQMMYGYPDRLPSVWSVDYTMGPVTKQGTPGEIEVALAHWVACKAGILLLSIGGSAMSRGLTSASLSIDGLSKSIGLQASAMYGVYSALETRMKEAEEAIDWRQLKLWKRGLRCRAY